MAVRSTDERPPSVRSPHRRLAVLAAVLGAVAVAGVAIIATRPGSADGRAAGTAETASPTQPSNGDRARIDRADAISAVAAQQRALNQGDRRAFLRTWSADADSQRTAGLIFTNLSDLRARVELHVRGSDPAVAAEDPAAVWNIGVEAVWRLPETRLRAASSMLDYTFAPADSTGRKVSAVSAADGARAPLWLTEALHVRRGPGWMVAAGTAAGANLLASDLPAVLRGVRTILSQSSSPIVVYAPATVDGMEATVGSPLLGLERVAGIAASIDGSRGRRAPVAVVLNPDQLRQLDQRGRTAVLAHEATHAMTGAGVVAMPLWLAEGFADYVGLEVADVPVDLAARVALRDARANGLPRSLPDQDAFTGGSRRDLELAYEQSWLAVRAMAQQFGEPAVLRLYQRVVADGEHGDLPTAVRTELGVDHDDLERIWRAEIRRLSDG